MAALIEMDERLCQAKAGKTDLCGGSAQDMSVMSAQQNVCRDGLVLRARCAAHTRIPLRASMTRGDDEWPPNPVSQLLQTV